MPRDQVIHIRCTNQEKVTWETAAALQGATVGSMTREALDLASGGTFVFPDVVSGDTDAISIAREMKDDCVAAREIIAEVREAVCTNGSSIYADELDQVTGILFKIERRFG